MTAPAFGLDVTAEPWTDAPAHDLPIEYWTGPVTIAGRVFDQPTTGLGFDERSRPWIHGYEIAEALRLTVTHSADLAAETKAELAYRAWEVEALALRDTAAAHRHVTQHVRPLLDDVPAASRERLASMVHDLVSVLASKRRLP
jgi:hypothetical protein